MSPIVSDLVQYKNNARDTQPLAGIITIVNENGTVEVNIFRGGLTEVKRNVVVATDAESAEAGQCWLSSTVKRQLQATMNPPAPPQISASQFPDVYANLGIDPSNLGCIMLNVEPIQVGHLILYDDLYQADPTPSPTRICRASCPRLPMRTLPCYTACYGLALNSRST